MYNIVMHVTCKGVIKYVVYQHIRKYHKLL